MPKFNFCITLVESAGMVIGPFGTKPIWSKSKLSRRFPSGLPWKRSVSCLESLPKLAQNYISLMAPLFDLLHDPRSHNSRATLEAGSDGGNENTVDLLTSSPISALSDWNKPFRLHTDASEAGVGFMQIMVRKAPAYMSSKWSEADEMKSPFNGESLTVLWMVDKFTSYL